MQSIIQQISPSTSVSTEPDFMPSNEHEFQFHCFTSKCISELSASKASGVDNISKLRIKRCASHIAPVLSTILNRSLQSGIFPACWKCAVIHPVYKKVDQGDMAN